MDRALGSKYMLEEVLGRGATGEVWRGRSKDGGVFAFKVLHDTLARDPHTVQRFLREKSILTGVDHPHVVRVHDLVVEGETLAIVMDLVGGSDLRTPLREHGVMRPGDACNVAAETAAGLGAIHDAGVVHRDVKPENVLLDMTRTPPAVRLTDFGIARIAEQTSSRSTMLVGTAPYIAPEVADGRPATPATDLYALGIMLYEMCCGVTPFADQSTLTILNRHGHHAPGRPDGIPDPLWELIEALLAKDPAARPAPAERVSILLAALARDLHQVPAAACLSAPPASIPLVHNVPTDLSIAPPPQAQGAQRQPKRSRRPLAIAAAGVVLLAVVGTGGYAAMRPTGNAAETGAVPSDAPAQVPAVSEPVTPTGTPTRVRATYGPGMVPDLVGLPEEEAKALLPASVDLQVVRTRPQGDEPDGVVLDQDPKPGAELPGTVQLTVSSRQAIQYLAELEPTSETTLITGTEAARYTLSGRAQLHAVGIDGTPCGDETGTAEYDLGQHYKKLIGIAGIDDHSASAKTQATIEFYGDSRKLKSYTPSLGKSRDLDVDVTGVLRLTLRWTFSGGDASLCHGGTLVLGDAQLVAAAGYVPPSTADPTEPVDPGLPTE